MNLQSPKLKGSGTFAHQKMTGIHHELSKLTGYLHILFDSETLADDACLSERIGYLLH